MDVTDLVNYNHTLLSSTHLTSSFFCLSKSDPSVGFAFDASNVAGQTYPHQVDDSTGKHLRTVYTNTGRIQLAQWPVSCPF